MAAEAWITGVSGWWHCDKLPDNPLAITKQKLERYRIIVSDRGRNLCTRDVIVDRFQEIGRRLCASHLRQKRINSSTVMARTLKREKETHPQVVMYRPTRPQYAKSKVPRVLGDRAAHTPEKRYIQQHCVHGVLSHHFDTRKESWTTVKHEYPRHVKVSDDSPSRAPLRSTLRLLRRSKPEPRSFHWFCSLSIYSFPRTLWIVSSSSSPVNT
jgi:hypothetical protein